MRDKAEKMIRSKLKQWKWNLRPEDSLEDLASEYNAKIRGEIVYYGRYSYSALVKVLQHIDYRLMLWATHKYNRLKGRPKKAKTWQ